MVHRTPQLTSEKLVPTQRGKIIGSVPTLGMFLHSRVPGLFPLSSDIASLASSFSELFLITCAFSRSVSWITGVVATFLYKKVLWRMLLLTPGGQQGQQKLWCSHDIVYRGQENRPLAREQAGLLGSLSSMDPHCPRASSSMGDQPETADRHA